MNDEELGLDSGDLDVIVLHDGTTMQTHGPARCFGTNCCIHNPSDHPLKDAPLVWMSSINLMLRMCVCGKPHPDPDSMFWLRFHAWVPFDGWHPCCPLLHCQDPLPDEEEDGDAASTQR